jgi:HTH-type transcriptional regulator / antitoxin HipB
MIQNEHQYKVTQTKLRELEKGFTDLLDAKDLLAPAVAQATKNSFQHEISKLKAELERYDNLKSGKIKIVLPSLENLPEALIERRVQLGITQKQLAEMLGTKEQVIQRYESSGYNGASLRRLKEVASHLST